MRIVIRFTSNRNKTGNLVVVEGDVKVFGPVDVCGRANDELANENNNASRNPLLPYGDAPFGKYKILGIRSTGTGTAYSEEEFGPHGLIDLQPIGGDAALADANGRFNFSIIGGSEYGEPIRCTNGSFRLNNSDLKMLIKIVREKNVRECSCLLDEKIARFTRKISLSPLRQTDYSRANSVGLFNTSYSTSKTKFRFPRMVLEPAGAESEYHGAYDLGF
jgi:hypothetical protein